jgi:hypothetical protein
MGISRKTHPGAGGPIGHPGWNLKPSAAHATAKDDAIRLFDRFVNADANPSSPIRSRCHDFRGASD